MNTLDSKLSPLFSLHDQVAIVTGGGSGIGRATATLFAAVGARVMVVDIDPAAAAGTAEEIRVAGGQASAFTLDIADETAIDRVLGEIVAKEGRIDIIVCNAGCGQNGSATEMPLESWKRVIDINLTGSFLCARTAARDMILRKNGGAIVFTASIMGLSGGGFGNNVNYQASKGAIVNLVRGLAVEWAPHGIRVNAVAPGWVKTQMTSRWSSDPERLAKIAEWVPLNRLADPEEIASAILFLASPAASMITGHTLPVDGGFMAK